MEMMLDKNQVWVILLFKFKMGHKAAATTCNINNAFGPGTANDLTVQWWFKKFCKGDDSLEDEERRGQPSEVDHDQLWWCSYSFPRSCWTQLNVDCSTVVWHLKQTGRVKKVDTRVPHELTKNFKNCHFWRVIFSYSVQQQRTISQSDCDVGRKVNCIWQLAMASSVVGLRKSSKTLHKARLALQKKSRSLLGSLLLVWPTTAFWILEKPLHASSMLDESESVSRSVMSDSLQPHGR